MNFAKYYILIKNKKNIILGPFVFFWKISCPISNSSIFFLSWTCFLLSYCGLQCWKEILCMLPGSYSVPSPHVTMPWQSWSAHVCLLGLWISTQTPFISSLLTIAWKIANIDKLCYVVLLNNIKLFYFNVFTNYFIELRLGPYHWYVSTLGGTKLNCSRIVPFLAGVRHLLRGTSPNAVVF